MRLPVRAFAEYLGMAVGSVSGWENKRATRPLRLSTQDILDQALKLADTDVRARFRQLLNRDGYAPATGEPPCGGARLPGPGPQVEPMSATTWG